MCRPRKPHPPMTRYDSWVAMVFWVDGEGMPKSGSMNRETGIWIWIQGPGPRHHECGTEEFSCTEGLQRVG